MKATITRAGAEALDRLRPLWLALHAHHQAVGGPELGPYVDDAASWAARRALYSGFLADGGFVLLAERDGELVGYAMVAIKTAVETELDDTSALGRPRGRDRDAVRRAVGARRRHRHRAARRDRRRARGCRHRRRPRRGACRERRCHPALRAARLPPGVAAHDAARGAVLAQ